MSPFAATSSAPLAVGRGAGSATGLNSTTNGGLVPPPFSASRTPPASVGANQKVFSPGMQPERLLLLPDSIMPGPSMRSEIATGFPIGPYRTSNRATSAVLSRVPGPRTPRTAPNSRAEFGVPGGIGEIGTVTMNGLPELTRGTPVVCVQTRPSPPTTASPLDSGRGSVSVKFFVTAARGGTVIVSVASAPPHSRTRVRRSGGGYARMSYSSGATPLKLYRPCSSVVVVWQSPATSMIRRAQRETSECTAAAPPGATDTVPLTDALPLVPGAVNVSALVSSWWSAPLDSCE